MLAFVFILKNQASVRC